MSVAPASASAASGAAVAERIMSVDALRGFDMFWIIGGQETVKAFLAIFIDPFPEWLDYHFEHVKWIGFSAWDMIMPLFLFVVGVSMPFSIAKRAQRAGYAAAYRKIIRRVIILWLIGMMVQGNLLAFDLDKLSVFSNTLQAIAAGYLIASIFLLHFGMAGQIAAIPVLLWTFCLAVVFIPFGGYPAFTLEPEHNLPLYIDQCILGRFVDGTTYAWVLGSLGFAATTLLGVMGGHVLKSRLAQGAKVIVLTGLGLGCLAAGWMWHQWFPIIKHLWTSSMVLWSGGWCFLLLALFYFVIDAAGFRKWAFPFVVIGMNAIAVYTATHLIRFNDIADGLVGGLAGQLGRFGAFLVPATALLLVWLILLYMYRKQTFIRI